MDNTTNSLNEGDSVSSEEERTNITTPKDFSHEEFRNREIPKHTTPSYKTSTNFKERLKSAEKHLQKIEQKKGIIDQRQVIYLVKSKAKTCFFNFFEYHSKIFNVPLHFRTILQDSIDMLAYRTLNKISFLNTRIEIIKQFTMDGEKNFLNEVYKKSNLLLIFIIRDRVSRSLYAVESRFNLQQISF